MLSKNSYIQFDNPFISLLSTGLDSPIATYLIMKKKMDCFSLSFLNGGEEIEENRNKIIQVGKRLVKLTHRQLRMHFVDYDRIAEQIQAKCNPKLTCVICKRTMILVARELAKFYNAKSIVNGDILGEQASQTLDNLYVVNQVNQEIPIIRPLIGFDKLDIIKISQELGFYELSLINGTACGFNPKFPETRAKIKEVIQSEENLNRDSLMKEIFDLISYIDIFTNNS
jgi:thiamine biosynthesis protein ThiI